MLTLPERGVVNKNKKFVWIPIQSYNLSNLIRGEGEIFSAKSTPGADEKRNHSGS